MELETIIGELVEGIYINENKRRFSCEVEIDGIIEQCYVASSSKLEQFVELKNNRVKLSKNNDSSKFKYTLWSVESEGIEVLLNLKKVNQIVENFIRYENLFDTNYDEILKEKVIENFKSDLILKKDNVIEIVEIKSLISTKKETLFPKAIGNRAIDQLNKLKKLLKLGYRVKYIIVALSPHIEKIIINSQYKQYNLLFKECVSLGMKVEKIKLECINNKIYFKFFN